MANNGEIKIGVGLDTKNLQSDAEDAKKKAKSALSGIGSVASGVAKGVAAVSAAMVAAGTAVVKVGSDFESAFAKVQTIMDPTQKSVTDMQAEILALSEATGVAASSLSDSVYNAISATGDTANAVTLVESATKLAAAGFTDTESSLGVITTAMNAYGLSAEQATKISDSLVQTQNLGVTTISELSNSMGKAIASASAYGIDLYNVEAAYVAMTKSGINTAESTTYMSSMFKELGSSSSKVAKALKKETGKSFAELMAEGGSLADALEAVYKAAGNDATALMNMWGSAEAGKAANAIINQGLTDFKDNLTEISSVTGTTESAYNTMADTVQHQTEMLTNSVKNLGIDLFNNFQPQINGLLQQANGWMGQLTDAFKSGGLDDLGNVAASIMPEMITTLTGMLEKGLTAFSAKMPNLIKNLMSALPKLLGSITTLAPQIAKSLFNGIGVAVQSLISMLPELIPMLAEGIGGLIESAVSGAWSILTGIDAGITTMLKDLGVVSKTAADNWDDVMKSVDNSKEKGIAEDIDANFKLNTTIEVDTVAFEAQMQTAADTIKTACANGITDPATAEEVANAIIKGDTTTVLQDALESMGIDETSAANAGKLISDAQDNINTAINALGISDEAKAHLADVVANGGGKEDIIKALEGQGLAEGDVEDVASTITGEQDKITAACKDLGIDEATITSINTSLLSDKAMLANALSLLGMKQEDIQPILDSYTTIANSLSAGLPSIFEAITTTLTDGKTDTPEQMSELETQVREWARKAYAKLDEWYKDELTSLQQSGMSGEQLDTAISNLDAKYAELSSGIKSTEEDTITWLDSMAGKSTAYVNGHLAELQDIESKATALAASIDALSLSAQEGNKYETSRNLTVAGRTQDSKTQLEAIKLTAAEYAAAVEEANNTYQTAVDKARADLDEGKISEAKYNEIEAAAFADLSAAYKDAEDSYNSWMQKILQGMAAANPEFAAKLKELADNQEIADIGSKVRDAINKGLSDKDATGTFDLSKILEDVQLSESDLQSFADAFGFESVDALKTALDNQIKSGDTGLLTSITQYQNDISDQFASIFTADSLSKLGVSDTIAATLSAAMEEGWTQAGNSIDWASGDAFTSAMASLGAAIEQNSSELPTAIKSIKATVEKIEIDPAGAEIEFDLGDTENPDTQETKTITIPAEPVLDVKDGENGSIADQAQTAVDTAMQDVTTGEPVQLVENAYVDLNVTATISGTDFSAAGATAAAQFAQGIASGSATSQATTLARNALNALSGAVGSVPASLGVDFATGYARGISSGSNTAINAAIRMAKAALQGVKDAQRSASPSKETAKLGQYFGEGYEIGIRESMTDAVATAKRMTGEILNASAIGSNGLGVIRVEAGSDPLMVQSADQPTPVILNGTKIAEVQAGNNSGAIAFANQKYKRSLGG